MSLKRSAVLMFRLELGFELLNKELEAAEFISQFLHFWGRRWCLPLRRRKRGHLRGARSLRLSDDGHLNARRLSGDSKRRGSC